MTRLAFLLATLAALAFGQEQQKVYDPARVEVGFTAKTLDLKVGDADRNRSVPVLIYLPKSKEKAPVILFSHGLGGSRTGCSYLGKHWAARGYVAVFLQHPGSDAEVWKNAEPRQRRSALRNAASGKNFRLRCEDVQSVLDELAILNAKEKHALEGRLDLEKVGMSGHSFGAKTTQAVSGERFGRLRPRAIYADDRIDAAIAFSPSSNPRRDADAAFGKVKIPWLLMTGTEDKAAIGGTTVKDRLAVFPALPKRNKYEVSVRSTHLKSSGRAG